MYVPDVPAGTSQDTGKNSFSSSSLFELLTVIYVLISDNVNNIEADMDFYYLLNGLNYNERIVIILFYIEDYSIKDIAKILKTNENTIKTRLRRAKGKIKDNYERS